MRKSTRVPEDGLSVEARAIKNTKIWNIEIPGLAWALWNARNKMAIEKKFPTKPIDVLFSGLSILQKWRVLLKEGEKAILDLVANKILRWSSSFKPSEKVMTDITVW
uniref:Uncharacterized protein n=1 Tax=Arundo donax TaxID=35708 RepID=A0A0A9BZX0_ARUDO